jgi:hypothetical protein
MQANQPIFGGRQLGKIQNSLKYKFRENMFREKSFRVFSLKKFRVNYSELFSEFFFRIWLRTTIETGSQEKNSEFFRHL